MTLLLIVLFAALAAAAAVVLADAGMRMRSAFAGIRAQQAMLEDRNAGAARTAQAVRVTTRVSYVRPARQAVPLRAAA